MTFPMRSLRRYGKRTTVSASRRPCRHGNPTKLADQTLGYDVSDQHTTTELTDGTRVEYLGDVTGRIVQRTETTPAPNPQTLAML